MMRVGNVVEILDRAEKLKAIRLEARVFNRNSIDHPYSNRYRYFGVYYGKDIIGMSRVNISPLKAWEGDDNYEMLKKMDPEAAISSLAVSPEHQRKGIARAIRKRLQDEFRSLLTGISRSYSNVPAMESMNEEMGFKKFLERAGGKNLQYFWKRDEL